MYYLKSINKENNAEIHFAPHLGFNTQRSESSALLVITYPMSQPESCPRGLALSHPHPNPPSRQACDIEACLGKAKPSSSFPHRV